MKKYEYLGLEREIRLKRKTYHLVPGEAVELPDDFEPGPQFRLVETKPKKEKEKVKNDVVKS
jgi:hypothetical protein